MTLLCIGRGQGEAAINSFSYFYFLANKIIVELACEWDTFYFLRIIIRPNVITERKKKSHVPSTFRLSLFYILRQHDNVLSAGCWGWKAS